MVPLELLTVPLDFLLILLVNGTPTAECIPMVIAQEIAPETNRENATEQIESFLQCQAITDSTENDSEKASEFLVPTTDLIESMNAALGTETDSEISFQLAPNPVSSHQGDQPN